MWTAALLFAAFFVARPAEPVRVPLAKVVAAEKGISREFAAMFPDEPWFLIGPTRGVYLDGLGAVFTAEINLATGPTITPFKTTITKEEVARHREKKEARVPLLRARMYSIVASIPNTLETMPDNEEIVLAVSLLRYPWEGPTNTPSQIILRVQRGKLMEAQRENAKPETVIRVEEY